MTNKMKLCRLIYYSLAALHVSRDILAHHQEHLNCITASGITVWMLLMISKYIPRNMYSNQGIINYPTHLHLVGHVLIIYHDTRKHEYQDDNVEICFFFQKLRKSCTKLHSTYISIQKQAGV
jgi:hypothetical protein